MKNYLLLLALLSASFLFSQNYYHDTQGKLEVSSSGSATYTLPIAMPPSIQNVGPVVNLNYSSGQMGGIAGQGWSINSISTISRMATRKDIDGFIDGVDFDNDDKFSLDGQRLLLKTGTYLASGSTYETETFSNTKIELFGVLRRLYFVVTAPDGSRSWYGEYGGTNATDPSSFYIVRYEDANGNYFTYHYTKVSNTLYVDEIKFSANATSLITPQNSIKFNYEDAKRIESSYIRGIKLEKARILKSVEVKTNNLLFRKYTLTHSTDAQLGYQKVARIQESNGAGELANPVIFEYGNTTEGGSVISTSYNNNINFNDVELSGDFDGDGRLDFTTKSQLFNNLFSGTNGQTPVNFPTQLLGEDSKSRFVATTLLNNRLQQSNSLVKVYKDQGAQKIEFKIYNLINGSLVNSYNKPLPQGGLIVGPFSTYGEFLEGDYNGDGLSEVLVLYSMPVFDGTSNATIEPQATIYDLNPNSTTAVGSKGNAVIGADDFLTSGFKKFIQDFNGDGKSDILVVKEDKSYRIYSFKELATAPWIQKEIIGQGVMTDYSVTKQVLFGDFNGDGKTDIILPNSEGGEGHAQWHIYYSNPNPAGGNFFVKESHEIVEYRPNTGNDYRTQVHLSNYYVLDVNRDGKSDLVRVWRKRYHNDWSIEDYDTQWAVSTFINNIGNTAISGSKFTPGYNTGTINSDADNMQIPIASSYKYQGANQEVVMIGDDYNQAIYVNFTKDVSQDALLLGVTSSGGNIKDIITYSSLTVGPGEGDLGSLSGFYSSGDVATYPFVEVKKAPSTKVVSNLVNTTEGITKFQQFRYHGLVVNMDGIGAMGFRKTARSEWIKLGQQGEKLIWSVEENNFLLRGATERSYSQLVNDSNAFTFVANGTPSGIISSTVSAFDYSIMPNKVFKISLTSQTVSDYLSDFKTIKTYAYSEPYLLPEAIITRNYFRINRASTLQGTYTTESQYENNPTGTGSSYYIGRLKQTSSKSAAYMGAIEIMDEKYTYTGNRLTKTEKRPNDTGYFLTEDYEYFPNGNLKKKTLSAPGSVPWTAPRTTEYTYDTSERYIKTVKDIEGLVTTNNTYDPLYGVVRSETNPFGQTTVSVYDNWGKRIKITDYLDKNVNYSYTKAGNEYTTYQYGDDGSESRIVADALGRTVKKGAKNINGVWSYISTEYDFKGRKVKSSEPYFDGGSPSQWNTILYDDYSRVKQTVAYTGLTTTITYSSGIFDTGAKVTIDDGTKITSTTKNSNGHTISATDPGGTIAYTYYSNGNLKTSTFDGTTLTMEYDLWGRKSKLIDPSAGTYIYEYYPFGEIYKETTPKGTTQYEYTPSGKVEMKSINGSQSNLVVFYTYNLNKQLGMVDGYDAQGNSFLVQYDYDNNKRLKKTVETNPESIFEKEFEYDDYGRIGREYNKATDVATGKSSAKWIRNTYLNGHHWQILDDAANAMLWQVDLVNQRGQLVTAHYGNSVGRLSQSYDAYGMPRVTLYRTINGNYSSLSPFLRLDTYFNASKGLLDKRINSMFSLTENFQYDSQERLTHFPNIAGQAEQQTYDNKGRITQNSTGTYSYSTQKAYQASKIALSQDAASHYDQRPLQQITYNAFKSPVSIYEQGKERIDFVYNLFQTRTTMYYGNEEVDKNLRPLRKYYSADGVMEIKRNIQTGIVDFITYIGGDGYTAPIIVKSDGTTQDYYYLHRDYLGSIMAVSNAAGQVVEKRHFDAWGNVVKLQNGLGVNLADFAILDRGYTGHEHLLKVGLINMNGRLYDPKVHRFLAPDNYVQDPTNTQNFNRYGYVLNNPLKYTDPNGEEFISAIIIGAGIAILTYTITALTSGSSFTAKGLLRSALMGAFTGAVTFGIGEATSAITQLGTRITAQALTHGAFQGGMAGVQGGNFWSGFASGSLSSLAASVYSGGSMAKGGSWKGLGGTFANSGSGMIAFGTVSGGAGAALTGGNFWQGAVTGLVVSGLNHYLHQQPDPNKELAQRIAKEYGYDWKDVKDFLDNNPFILTHKGVAMAGKEVYSTKIIEDDKTIVDYVQDQGEGYIKDKIIEFLSPKVSDILGFGEILLTTQTAHAPNSNYQQERSSRINIAKEKLIKYFFEKPATYQTPTMHNNQQSYQYHSSRFDRMRFRFY